MIRTVTHLKFEDHQTIHILPEIKVEFVDIDSIVAPNRAAIQEMKKLYSKKEAINIGINETFTVSVSPKYTQDLFYIGPFYSSAFSSLNRKAIKKTFSTDISAKSLFHQDCNCFSSNSNINVFKTA